MIIPDLIIESARGGYWDWHCSVGSTAKKDPAYKLAFRPILPIPENKYNLVGQSQARHIFNSADREATIFLAQYYVWAYDRLVTRNS